MREYYRQGDVILEIVAAIPRGKQKRLSAEDGRLVLAHGEVTGHSHGVLASNGEAELVELIDEIERYLVVWRQTPLVHEEHGDIDLPPGIYHVRIQRQYQPDGIQRVTD